MNPLDQNGYIAENLDKNIPKTVAEIMNAAKLQNQLAQTAQADADNINENVNNLNAPTGKPDNKTNPTRHNQPTQNNNGTPTADGAKLSNENNQRKQINANQNNGQAKVNNNNQPKTGNNNNNNNSNQPKQAKQPNPASQQNNQPKQNPNNQPKQNNQKPANNNNPNRGNQKPSNANVPNKDNQKVVGNANQKNGTDKNPNPQHNQNRPNPDAPKPKNKKNLKYGNEKYRSKPVKIVISGGGTGGHVFPAIAIANAFKRRHPDAKILFIGAAGRLEMERVPVEGYPIEGLPVVGFDRKKLWKNIIVLRKFLKSLKIAKEILKNFEPDVVVGVGGYASGPALRAASSMGIPTLIQEQNSYAGLANKILGWKAKTVCVAYEGMKKYFPAKKIVLTGNPVRRTLEKAAGDKVKALNYFHFVPAKKTVLVLGGSLGARSINKAMSDGVDRLMDAGIQVIWQTGKLYHAAIHDQMKGRNLYGRLWYSGFIARMDYAYSAADLVVSRAGATSISELCLLRKPAVLVPSPNVAEDHQTKNAKAVVARDAAVMVPDKEAITNLIDTVLQLVNDTQKLKELGKNAATMAYPRSADMIVDEIEKLAKKMILYPEPYTYEE